MIYGSGVVQRIAQQRPILHICKRNVFGLLADSALRSILWRYVSLQYWNTPESFPVTDVVVCSAECARRLHSARIADPWDCVENLTQILPFVAYWKRLRTGFCITLVRKATVASSYLSVCPQGTTRLLVDGFSWNFIFECFSKICPEKSNFIKI